MIENPEGYRVEEGTLDKVDTSGDWWHLRLKDSWSFGIPMEEAAEAGYVPEVGDRINMYYHGFNTIAGIAAQRGDQVWKVRYRTEEDINLERAKWLAEREKEKAESFLKNVEDWRARVTYLPEPYRKRIERFERRDGIKEFWMENGAYELFCLEQSAIMVEWAREKNPDDPVKALTDWDAMNSKAGGYDYKGQVEAMPGYSEGHSGNTHGAAVYLAECVLTGIEI